METGAASACGTGGAGNAHNEDCLVCTARRKELRVIGETLHIILPAMMRMTMTVAPRRFAVMHAIEVFMLARAFAIR